MREPDPPTLPSSTIEILNSLLSRAAHPRDAAIYLADRLRELSAARCAVLIHYTTDPPDAVHKILAVSPEPTLSWAQSPSAASLYQFTHKLPESHLLHASETGPLAESLAQEGFDLLLAIPLTVETMRVGSLLLLGLPDEDRVRPLLTMLGTLSSTMALIAEGCREFDAADIGERRSAEEAIREESTLRRILFEHSPDGILTLDPATSKIIEFNTAAHMNLGYTREEFSRLSIRDIDASETDEQTKARIAGVVKEGKADFETLQRTKGGELRDVHVTAQFIDYRGRTVYHCIWRDITKRKRAEAALRESEERLRSLIQNLNAGIVVYDPDIRILLHNQMARSFLGLSGEQMDGMPESEIALHLFHENGRPMAPEEYPAMRVLLTSRPVENLVVGVDRLSGGDRAWALVNAFPDFDERQRLRQVVVSFVDITEREEALDSLRKERRFTETLLQSLPGIFYLYSYPELRLVRWNQNHETQLGYEPGEIDNRSIFDWHPPEMRDLVRQAVEVVLDKGESKIVSPLLTKDGRLVPFLMTGARLEIQGKLYLMGVGIDISESRRAEEALRESETRQSAMIANVADVIAIIDQNGINRYKSPNVEKWFGWRPEELIGSPTWENVHKDDLTQTQAVFMGLLGEPGASATSECRYRCKDGSYKWIEYTAANFLHDTTIRGILLNYRDISERKRAEEEREKLQGQLTQAQKMESVGRLAGGVAHDFNNMLGAIIGYTEMAMEQVDPGQSIHSNLKEIRKAAERSADLTRQLLAFARKQTVIPKVLDLNETVGGMLNMLRRLIGEDIDLEWRPGAGSSQIRIDPSQVDQVLANLCVNARDAISGIGKVTIETENVDLDVAYCEAHGGATPGEYVALSVSDDGSGMDKETLDHVFEPFFTTKKMGKGTGLGLSTVYGIVRQNQGLVNVYSESGRGTTFKIYLPRYEGQTERAQAKGSLAALGQGHETILLVEDEPAVLNMAKTMLGRLGYRVLAAGTPSEAIRLAELYAGDIHLLMTDVIMPEMNGRDLSEKLLSLYPGLKRLFMSGYTADVIAHQGVLEAGMHFIQKPFSMRALAAKVREAIE